MRDRGLVSSWAVAMILAACGAFVAFAIVIEGGGARSVEVITVLFANSFGSRAALTETLVKATPILLCAIASAIPGRLGLVNIGGEGQLIMGAIGSTFAVREFASGNATLLIMAMAGCAMIAGGVWGLLPGSLRAISGANETVVSLLLNYVAGLFLLHLIHGPWKDPASLGWAQTASFPNAARLPVLPGTRIHILLVGGIAAAALLAVVYRHTTWGFSSRIMEASLSLASYSGLRVGRMVILAFALGAAAAGLAGFGEAAGIHGRLREGISPGYGYTGFLVAWLCRGRFEWVPVAALVLGGVIAAGDSLQVFSGLPFATTSILQGLLFIGVLVAEAMRSRQAAAPVEVAG